MIESTKLISSFEQEQRITTLNRQWTSYIEFRGGITRMVVRNNLGDCRWLGFKDDSAREREPLEFKRLVRTVGTRRQIFFRFSCDVRGTADASGSATTWSPFMAFPGQDPEDRGESKWRTSYGRLRPFVSLSRPVPSPIVYIDRSTIVNAIRDTWKPWNTRSTLARNDHLGWPFATNEHDVK